MSGHFALCTRRIAVTFKPLDVLGASATYEHCAIPCHRRCRGPAGHGKIFERYLISSSSHAREARRTMS